MYRLGDFNLNHPLRGSSEASRNSESFVQWLADSCFCLLNFSDPTHVANSKYRALTRFAPQIFLTAFLSDNRIIPMNVTISQSPYLWTLTLRYSLLPLIIDVLTYGRKSSEIFAEHFSEYAAHDPLRIIYGDVDCMVLNTPFKLSGLTEDIHRTKSTPHPWCGKY